ncbi:MAG: penicillin acylase family protein [Myxococcota bacterium]|nr:penicillin acylase family protein [Myxococcota bacterium]
MLRRALILLAACHASPAPPGAVGPVTIERDDWGIAHIHGATDADAVFGMIYAQAEDNFAQIESNYLAALGRLAEADGESAIWQDLRARMFLDPDRLRRDYAASPAPLRTLMDAWADGLNQFLADHPAVKPRVLVRFEPWMALAFTEGSIGADLEGISVDKLAAFYGEKHASQVEPADPTGSNGIAIAPRNTRDGHSLLLINPHTALFFRSELQMTSNEGLDAYGAVTWGQFFIYQGFNARVGWMHTSSGVDSVDEWAETIEHRGNELVYRHGAVLRPVEQRTITLSYRTRDGRLAQRTITTYRTHHGPIVRSADGKWIATNLMVKPIEALSQSYLRTKATDLAGFRAVMKNRANSTNNTIYADADGHVAYFHPQFIPVRDDRFDWTKPVDGSDPATDWRGEHGVDDPPHVLDPSVGWVMNTNNHPYSAAGPDSPKRETFPRYMDRHGETPRGWNALRLLTGAKGWTIDSLRDAAYDSYLPLFEKLVPRLLAAARDLPPAYAEPLALLRTWDLRWSAESIPTTLAVFWGMMLLEQAPDPDLAKLNLFDRYARDVDARKLVDAWVAAVERLSKDFGTWRMRWGDVNRFQRATDFDDAAPSIAVPFTASMWGSLAAFGARTGATEKKLYGVKGNSFVAIVEFGPRVRARAIMAGGASADPTSKHFADQAMRYTRGELRDVYFYPDQRAGKIERRYQISSWSARRARAASAAP